MTSKLRTYTAQEKRDVLALADEVGPPAGTGKVRPTAATGETGSP